MKTTKTSAHSVHNENSVNTVRGVDKYTKDKAQGLLATVIGAFLLAGIVYVGLPVLAQATDTCNISIAGQTLYRDSNCKKESTSQVKMEKTNTTYQDKAKENMGKGEEEKEKVRNYRDTLETSK